MQIREDDLTDERILRFLDEHLENMYATTSPESVHALDIDELRSADVTFWSAWDGEDLLGCGALKRLDSRTGEIKSMRTAETRRSRGVGSRILEHIIREAERRGYDRLHLETGSMSEFAPARAFYESNGFEYRGPFGEYTDDPNSVFMTRKL